MESVIPLGSHNTSESEQDLDYEAYSESIFSTSPSEQFWSQTIHPRLEIRMNRKIYRTNKRCLVENTIHASALSYVHCLSRRLEPRRVNALEFAWGMQRGTLNLDTHFNIFCLSPNFKEFWEIFKWFLLPEDDIIHRFHDAAMNGQEFPDIDEGPYSYRFVPHPAMKPIAIHRQIVFPDNETDELKPEHFMFCSYPFENIDTLTCHLHPKFVICHIGWMAAKANDMFLSKYADAHPGLLKLITMILQICNKWTRPLHKNDPKHLSFLQNKIDPDDIVSENFSRTVNGRLKPHLSERRLLRRRNSVKRKRKESASNLVTTKKLRILGEQISPEHATGKKLGDILSWRSNVLDECDSRKVENNEEKTNDITTGGDVQMDDTDSDMYI